MEVGSFSVPHHIINAAMIAIGSLNLPQMGAKLATRFSKVLYIAKVMEHTGPRVDFYMMPACTSLDFVT